MLFSANSLILNNCFTTKLEITMSCSLSVNLHHRSFYVRLHILVASKCQHSDKFSKSGDHVEISFCSTLQVTMRENNHKSNAQIQASCYPKQIMKKIIIQKILW